MAVHLQPFCGKLNRLREQPAGAQPKVSKFILSTSSRGSVMMQPTFRGQLETSGPTETREAWHGQWALYGTVIAPYGRQSTLQAGHSEARHFAEQMPNLLRLKPMFQLPRNSSLSRL